jgi:hypothetical protein
MQNTKRTILIAILACAGLWSEESAVNQKKWSLRYFVE